MLVIFTLIEFKIFWPVAGDEILVGGPIFCTYALPHGMAISSHFPWIVIKGTWYKKKADDQYLEGIVGTSDPEGISTFNPKSAFKRVWLSILKRCFQNYLAEFNFLKLF